MRFGGFVIFEVAPLWKKNPFHAGPVISISPLEVFPPVFSHVHLSEAGKSSKSFEECTGSMKRGWMVSWAPQVIYV